jgi:hypothetical protein
VLIDTSNGQRGWTTVGVSRTSSRPVEALVDGYLFGLLHPREADAAWPRYPSRMRIREAEPKDARAIAEVHVGSWRAAYRASSPTNTSTT